MGIIGASMAGFVLKHWMAFALGGIVLAAGLYVEGLRLDNAHLHKSLTACAANVATLKANQATLEGAIQHQNAAVQAAADESARSTAAAQSALAQAEHSRVQTARSVSALAAAKPSSDVCASADALILRSLSSGGQP